MQLHVQPSRMPGIRRSDPGRSLPAIRTQALAEAEASTFVVYLHTYRNGIIMRIMAQGLSGSCDAFCIPIVLAKQRERANPFVLFCFSYFFCCISATPYLLCRSICLLGCSDRRTTDGLWRMAVGGGHRSHPKRITRRRKERSNLHCAIGGTGSRIGQR